MTPRGCGCTTATAARPLEVFDEDKAPMLLPVPPTYDVPIFKQVKVHRDFHAEVARVLYSIPGPWIGSALGGAGGQRW